MVEYHFLNGVEPSVPEMRSLNDLLTQLTTNSTKLEHSDLIKVLENSKLLVARLNENDEIIGMATLATITIPTGRFGRIEDVVVSDQYRGQGIGKALIQGLIEEGKNLGLKRIDLTSSPKRVAANKLYRDLGFENVETNVYRLVL